MMQFYPEIKWLHVAAVMCSGLLFAIRGVARLAGAHWTMAAPLRYLSVAIDTALLAAAITLAVLLQQYPFVHAWLTVKVLLLVAYIVLGSLALKRARTRKARALCLAAALVVYLLIIGVARTHHPLGILSGLL